MPANATFPINLTRGQVGDLLSRVNEGQIGPVLILALDARLNVRDFLTGLLREKRCSQTIIRALLVLTSFPEDGTHLSINGLAKELNLSHSVVHRYVTTWLVLGLLEQDEASLKYARTVRL